MARPSSSLPFDFEPPPEPAPRPTREPPRAMTVGELDRVIKRSLDGSFASNVIVEGEVSGARPAGSGHLYFSLKDEREDACIDVAIYKTNITPRMRAVIADGARIRVRGRPSFWAPRGRLQFVADGAQLAGRGALLEALEKLKAKLAAEGLFAIERKRPIPIEPRVIGVVTSKTGAVIHDICKVAFRRGGARLLLAPAVVQGAGAALSIRRALADLQRVRGVDVIIVGRGGGSSDDLLAFNDEDVVRAVAACRVPVIGAVGHEVDVTLTDFAADARAATPSQAAEMVVPDLAARRDTLRHSRARLRRAAAARIDDATRRLHRLERRIEDPRLLLASYQQSLDDRVEALEGCMQRPIDQGTERLRVLERRLAGLHPSVRIADESRLVAGLSSRLTATMRSRQRAAEHRLHRLAAGLDAMSPLRVLGRGYAIATTSEGRAVRRAAEVKEGESLDLRLAEGRLSATVTAVDPPARDVARPRSS